MNDKRVANQLIKLAKELTAYVGEKAAVFTNSGLLQVAVGEDYYMIDPNDAAKLGEKMLSVIKNADKDMKRNFSIAPISNHRPHASIASSMSSPGKIRISATAAYMVDDDVRDDVADYFESKGYVVKGN